MSTNHHFLLGLQHCKQENFAEAIVFFSKSIEFEPLHVESFYNRAMARLQLGELQKALMDFDEAVNLAPKNAQIYGERAVVKHHLKDNRGAMEDFDIAVKLEPLNGYRYASRAYIKAFIGDTWGAQIDYKKAIELDPEDAVSYNNLGLLEEQMGYQTEAQANFAQADQIADQGKTFERPSLDEILKKHEEKEKTRLESLQMQKQPKGTGEQITENQRLNLKTYLRTVKEVFTSQKVFGEFMDFMRGKWKKKA